MNNGSYFEKPSNETGDSKFVQLYVDEVPLIRTSRPGEHYHKSILQRSLEEIGIKNFEFVQIRDTNRMVVSPEGTRYRAVGMGRIEIKDGDYVLRGISSDYDIGPSEGHLKDLERHLPNDVNIELR